MSSIIYLFVSYENPGDSNAKSLNLSKKAGVK